MCSPVCWVRVLVSNFHADRSACGAFEPLTEACSKGLVPLQNDPHHGDVGLWESNGAIPGVSLFQSSSYFPAHDYILVGSDLGFTTITLRGGGAEFH